MNEQSSNMKKLKKVLVFNAIFSILCAIDLIFLSNWVGGLIGINETIYLQVLGAGLIAFALFVLWVSQNLEKRKLVELVIQMDRSWVVGSVILLFFFNDLLVQSGLIIVSVIALIVLTFGELQNYFNKQLVVESEV